MAAAVVHLRGLLAAIALVMIIMATTIITITATVMAQAVMAVARVAPTVPLLVPLLALLHGSNNPQCLPLQVLLAIQVINMVVMEISPPATINSPPMVHPVILLHRALDFLSQPMVAEFPLHLLVVPLRPLHLGMRLLHHHRLLLMAHHRHHHRHLLSY